MNQLRVAVIGTGIIGTTLARRFVEAGHAVTIGTRTPARNDADDLTARTGASLATVEDALETADAVVWAINGAAMAEAIPAHAALLKDKTVIDATNNIGAPDMNSVGLIAEHAPAAQIYRAFNSLGWENFDDAQYGDIPGDLLYTGPEGPAQTTAETLIAATGLRPVRVGDNDKVTIVDNLATLWFALAFGQGMGRNLGFKILTR